MIIIVIFLFLYFSSISLFSQESAQDFYIKGTKTVSTDSAISYLNKAINLDSKFVLAYFSRGMAHFKRNDFLYALSDFAKTIELDSLFADAYFYRGTIKNMLENNIPPTTGNNDIENAKRLGSKLPNLKIIDSSKRK